MVYIYFDQNEKRRGIEVLSSGCYNPASNVANMIIGFSILDNSSKLLITSAVFEVDTVIKSNRYANGIST